MTKKLTISLPDDLAERLAQEPNVSAFVADSLRRRVAGEKTRAILQSAGFTITEEGVARVRAEMEQLRTEVTPELKAEAAQLQAEVAAARARARR